MNDRERIKQLAIILLNTNSIFKRNIGSIMNLYLQEYGENATIYGIQMYLRQYIENLIDVIIEIRR